MAVDLCARLHSVDAQDVTDLVGALVAINVRVYRSGLVKSAPWRIRWYEDAMGGSVKMEDVRVLERLGRGSCGPLAAAYAAWLIVNASGATIRVIPGGKPDAWHVITVDSRGDVYDPMEIGRA